MRHCGRPDPHRRHHWRDRPGAADECAGTDAWGRRLTVGADGRLEELGDPERGAPALLTDLEHRAMALTAELWESLRAITCEPRAGTPGTELADLARVREQDLHELAVHLHALQNAILAQAAARAYPDRYRLMGGRVAREARECCPTEPGSAHADDCHARLLERNAIGVVPNDGAT